MECDKCFSIQDYRITACLGILVWLTENHTVSGYKGIADPVGEVWQIFPAKKILDLA